MQFTDCLDPPRHNTIDQLSRCTVIKYSIDNDQFKQIKDNALLLESKGWKHLI